MDEEGEASVIARIAHEISDRAETIEEGRGKLLHLLHPSREHFEKIGWPGDAPVPATAPQ
jgi:hypothetical protein